MNDSAAVFRGIAARKEQLRSTRSGRPLYAVHFTVEETWKGPQTREVVVYDTTSIGDCEGFDFEQNKEYVVFVRQRAVMRDTPMQLDGKQIIWPDFWNQALPVGKKILISEICTNIDKVAKATQGGILKQLGPGKKPL